MHSNTYTPKYRSTRSLRRMMAILCAMMCAQLSQTRHVLHHARRVGRIVQDIIQQEKQNALILAKAEMLRTPSWRARVIKDLGGLRALCAWEARFEKIQQSPRVQAQDFGGLAKTVTQCTATLNVYSMPKDNPPCPAIYFDRFKTDQEGQFRLPPLGRPSMPTLIRHNAAYTARRAFKSTLARKQFYRPCAIAVFPHEFHDSLKKSRLKPHRQNQTLRHIGNLDSVSV